MYEAEFVVLHLVNIIYVFCKEVIRYIILFNIFLNVTVIQVKSLEKRDDIFNLKNNIKLS